MEILSSPITDWQQLTQKLGKEFANRAAKADQEGNFVFENYRRLKEHGFFSAMIPANLGGSGLSHTEMCNIIRILGQHCGSTALAFSMHQHLLAATIWKYQHQGEGEALLRKVVDQQLVLISTGAKDWLDSNGKMEKVEGGYLLSAKKSFASQSAYGDLAITSAPYYSGADGWKVLHFPVSMKSEGVVVLNDWKVMGMRATGSQTIRFDQVFIPEDHIKLIRPRGEYHGVLDVVLGVAMPLIMAAYVGIAERAKELALEIGSQDHRNQAHLPYLMGKLNNQLLSAQVQWRAMYAITNNLSFTPSRAHTNDMISLKTNVSEACIKTVNQAMECIGGQSFYQKNEMERLFRDVHAAPFHPLPKWEQYLFTGTEMLHN